VALSHPNLAQEVSFENLPLEKTLDPIFRPLRFGLEFPSHVSQERTSVFFGEPPQCGPTRRFLGAPGQEHACPVRGRKDASAGILILVHASAHPQKTAALLQDAPLQGVSLL
jgi:hypothetical protein